MACMNQAMVEQGAEQHRRQRLWQAFFQAAEGMRNRAD